MHGIPGTDRRRQVACHLVVHEQADMLTNPALFIDHSKAHAGKALLQVGQHFLQRTTRATDIGGVLGVGTQRAGDIDSTGHSYSGGCLD